MATYTRQMQAIVEEYRADGQPWPATAKTIATWAILTRRWELPPSAAVNKCAADIAEAMREEYTTDAKGRRVRVKHATSVWRDGEQTVLWHDLRDASREDMQMAFQQRRRAIVSDCRQLKTDVDSYNDAHPEAEPIQMVFDFGMDLAEIEAAEAA